MSEACSPAISTSANSIGPQEYDVSAYWMHSWSAAPLSIIGVSVSEPSAAGTMRSPIEPVSTFTLLIAAQFEVPCWQTVTVTNSTSTSPPAPGGPKLAVTGTVLLTGPVTPVVWELLPQPAIASKHTTPSNN